MYATHPWTIIRHQMTLNCFSDNGLPSTPMSSCATICRAPRLVWRGGNGEACHFGRRALHLGIHAHSLHRARHSCRKVLSASAYGHQDGAVAYAAKRRKLKDKVSQSAFPRICSVTWAPPPAVAKHSSPRSKAQCLLILIGVGMVRRSIRLQLILTPQGIVTGAEIS